jgi:hypothetical protein
MPFEIGISARKHIYACNLLEICSLYSFEKLYMIPLFIIIIHKIHLFHVKVTKMGSSRNMAVLGLSVFIGLTIPTWAQSKEKPIDTGMIYVFLCTC